MNGENDLRTRRLNRWQAFLASKHIDYGKALPEEGSEDMYVLIMKSDAPEFSEYPLMIDVRPAMLFFEAVLPIAVRDKDTALALINDLNIQYPVGLFQYKESQHELSWNHFLAFGEGLFPEKRAIDRAIRTTNQMMLLLKDKLISTVSEQVEGKKEGTHV